MNIQDVFSGKNFFITGGSGFIGKVLIEKLLRVFPDLGNIYVLMRSKRGRNPQERLSTTMDNMLFDKLRSSNPDALKKVIAIEGDICKTGLGICDEDRKFLINNVNIIYHSGASVKFDDPLPYAIRVNVRSTRDLIELAKEVKQLLLFVHISTTYCNMDKTVVEEKLYPSHGDWREAIMLAEEGDQGVTDAFTRKYIQPLANTYTYAKSLAEHVVVDLCEGIIPSIILRPSVVIPVAKEPVPGWADNLNGPAGLLSAGGKGLVRIGYGNTESVQDFIPVDVVVSFLIYSAYLKMKKKDVGEIEIYNNTKYNLNDFKTGSLLDMGRILRWDSPFAQVLWFPRFSMTKCFYSYYIQVLLFHMIPAFFLDILLKIFKKKPMLFSIQRKIFIANTILKCFLEKTWYFKNYKSMEICRQMQPEDRPIFDYENVLCYNQEKIYNYYRDCRVMIGMNIFKEKMDLEEDRKHTYRLWLLDIAVKSIFSVVFLWYFIYRTNFLHYLFSKVENYLNLW